MKFDGFAPVGAHVRLEPLGHQHIPGLLAAAAGDAGLYQWSPVPRNEADTVRYVETALAWRDAGTALPLAIVRAAGDVVLGSTRFWNLEHWAWPPGHALHHRQTPDACEIGYTWLTRSAVRSPVNTEVKTMMLTHAFEVWDVFRVCFHSDVRNVRSRAALERLGARFEGVLRAHRMAVDGIARDSARYSIVANEWPVVKQHLARLRQSRTR